MILSKMLTSVYIVDLAALRQWMYIAISGDGQ